MGMTDLGIDPASANSAAQFVDLLRRVRVASELSYRQIAQRARAQGVALPISTLATALNRDTMPRQEVVTAMLLACGCSREELAVWLAARRRIVTSTPSTADETESPETSPDTPDAPVAGRWNRLPLNRVSIWALVAAIVVAGAGVTWWATDRAPEKPAAVPTDSNATVRVRPLTGPGCLSEHTGSTGYLFIEPCEQAFPTLKVESVAGGAVRFRTSHPEFGEGCMGVDPVADDDRPSDGYCTDVKHQLFTLSEAGGGHLLRNVELGQCLAVRPEAGARAVVFAACSADDPAQLFAVDRI
ncbi:MAG: XRE family transcriptional regulator [Hamadaea sp.]|uniref:helix-turn-helix domain-containing protein n=1 Tax=Hamadaea sp. TaxID=2024425 RepID=UPI00180A492F|nr:helix-turn-helix domain-containing protein [Hamadaea sp.]NUR70393.1 XRE family transcriptional regulator [Hamadaea sp.]NUT20553.1 XRE family transcriptional regulator [Hamadaea sp.]